MCSEPNAPSTEGGGHQLFRRLNMRDHRSNTPILRICGCTLAIMAAKMASCNMHGVEKSTLQRNQMAISETTAHCGCTTPFCGLHSFLGSIQMASSWAPCWFLKMSVRSSKSNNNAVVGTCHTCRAVTRGIIDEYVPDEWSKQLNSIPISVLVCLVSSYLF